MSCRVWSGPWAALIGALLFTVACAAPPTREMDQAQGAIDAARAAGADRYAAEQFDGAVKALKSAHDAVAQRDYRLALSHALDSRDRAQRAAKEGAEQQGVLRSAAERSLTELAAALDRARMRLAAATTAGVPRRTLTEARAAVADAEASLQKAGTGIQEGNYQTSQERLAESAKKLQSSMAEIDTVLKARGVRPRR
jgi:hypothetical protein